MPTSSAAGQGAAADGERAAPLHGERVHGVVLRSEREDARQGLCKALRRVRGQPGDQIHVHVKPAHRAHQGERFKTMSRDVCLLPMASSTLSDMVCGFTLTRRTPWAFSTSSLVAGDGVRTAGLDGVLTQVCEIEAVLQPRTQLVELRGAERRGACRRPCTGQPA